MIACASFLGENAQEFHGRVVAYLADRTGQPLELLPPLAWGEQLRRLDAGDIRFAFLCGLPYVEKREAGLPLELLAAPVMAAERYAGRPVYFTDVVVRADSPARSFADLRGRTWAYNGIDSNSGYNMPRDYLLSLGETSGFFGGVTASGSHQKSIEMVLDGAADASGIDSLVLDVACAQRPDLGSRIRIIHSVGPCPAPPVVVSGLLPRAVRAELRDCLLSMHEEAGGRDVLRSGLLARFGAVDDVYYNPVREMVRRAEAAGYRQLK